MPLPEYIPTRLVSGGGAFGLESGEPIRVRVRAQASRQLVWSATGQVFGIDPVTKTSEPGESVYFDLPVTDAAGWRDRKTNQLIDVSAPGSHTHTYNITISLLDKRGSVLRGSEIEFDHVAIPTGATTIDLDTLVPGTTTTGVVVQFPDEWRAITEEARAEATAAALSADAAADSAAAAAQSAADAIEAVESKIDEDQIGAAGGVAALGSDSKLLEVNVPTRLSEAGLSNTIAGSAFGIAANSRPRGNRTVLMGDSITAYNGGTSTATPVQPLSGFSSLGMWRWANIMLRQRLEIVGNSGIGGQEASQIRARFLTDVMALNPDILALLAGTNDDGPEDTTWDHLQWMYETALASGIFIVAFTIPPQAASVAGNTPALQSYRQGVNTQIRQFVRSHAGMLLIDLADLWQDKTQPGFVARAEYVPDGTHPGTLGAQVGGYAIARAITPVLPAAIEAAPSSVAPDNMLTNGRFAGTGTAAPAGWSTTGSPTFAYVPGRDGIGQRLAVTVPVGGTVTLTQNINKGVLLREGDAYDFTVDVEPYDLEVAGASSQRINTFVQAYDGSSFARGGDAVYIDGGSQYGSARYPARSGRFRTQRAVFGAGRTLVQVVITLTGGGTYLLSEAVARNLTMLDAGIAAPENVPHTNLIANGTFETDTADWSGGASAVVARSTAQKHSGAASLSIQHNADANSDGRYKKVAVAPSTAVNYVAWVNAPAGFAGKMNFNWYIAGGSFISQTSVTFTGTGQWQKLIGTIAGGTVPANASEMLLTVGRGDATGTPLVYLDDVDCWQG